LINLLELWRGRHASPPGAYSGNEVLAILRGDGLGERAESALELISEPTAWLPADNRRAFGHLAWYAERLPTILHLYRRGWAPEQIGRRLSPFSGGWPVEQTLDRAAELIAARINDRLQAA
jgi:hypothetical protein